MACPKKEKLKKIFDAHCTGGKNKCPGKKPANEDKPKHHKHHHHHQQKKNSCCGPKKGGCCN